MAEKKTTKKKSGKDCEDCKKNPRAKKNGEPCCEKQDKPRVLVDGYSNKPLARVQNALFIVKQKHPKAEIVFQCDKKKELTETEEALFKGVKLVVGDATKVREKFLNDNPDAWIYRTSTFMSTKTIHEHRNPKK